MPKTRSAADDLAEGWEPSPLPGQLPDGSLGLPPLRAPTMAAPSLCELGPCVHYHRMTYQIDAAAPTDGSPGGLFQQTAHTCYPTPGIEIELRGTPVFECSLWTPMSQTAAKKQTDAGRRQLKTKDGKRFLHELASWRTMKEQQFKDVPKIEPDPPREGEDARHVAAEAADTDDDRGLS